MNEMPLGNAVREVGGLMPSKGRSSQLNGRLVASLLAGAWRDVPPPHRLSPSDLAEITPLLLRTGAAGLGWWAVRQSDLGASGPAFELRQAYRLHTLQAGALEGQIIQSITLLRAAGVEPLLARGWAAARLYPERGLRPFGDIDLWVRPDQHASAAAALNSPEGASCPVDLHQSFRHFERGWDELYTRSQLKTLGPVKVRILGPEDHLRLLCLHMLFHGVWRPSWLCDIAAALESLPPNFDWEYCLEGKPRYTGWVACAIGLANQLLGARLDRAPEWLKTKPLPRWLVPSVLLQWQSTDHYMQTPSMAFCLRHPSSLLTALRLRWPNPIQATVGVGGPFNGLPRFPFQLAECVARSRAFLGRGMRSALDSASVR